MRKMLGAVGPGVALGCVALTSLVGILSWVRSQQTTARSEVVLGYVPASLEYPYNVATARGFESEAKALGARVVLLDPRGSVERQGNSIDDLMALRVQGIAILPLDSVIAEGWVDKVAATRTPVVALAVQVGDPRKYEWRNVYPSLTALVGMDYTASGVRAGEMAASLLPTNRTVKIGIVEGAPGYPQVWQSTEGFKEGLEKSGIKYEIVASQPTDWTPERGEAVCQNVITSRPDVDMIFSQADDMALGCARAIRPVRSRVKLVAMGGGSKLGIQAIEDGEIDGSVCVKPYETGRLAARALFEAVTGKNTSKRRLIAYDTPPITKANLPDCPEHW